VWNTLWRFNLPVLCLKKVAKTKITQALLISKNYFEELNSDFVAGKKTGDMRLRAVSGKRRSLTTYSDMSVGDSGEKRDNTQNLREEFLSNIKNIFGKAISGPHLIQAIESIGKTHDKKQVDASITLFLKNLNWRLSPPSSFKIDTINAEIDCDAVSICFNVNPSNIIPTVLVLKASDIVPNNVRLNATIDFLDSVFLPVIKVLDQDEDTIMRERYNSCLNLNCIKGGNTQMSGSERSEYCVISYASANCILNVSASRGESGKEGENEKCKENR
jgi:hypothetical protein